MAKRVKADCGANLLDHSYALNDARFTLVSSGTLKPEPRHSFPLNMKGRRPKPTPRLCFERAHVRVQKPFCEFGAPVAKL
jgi:hypothetical protein